MRKACAECPFAKTTPCGDTGGADPGVYIGQAYGPFFLPCHMDPKYYENRRSPELLQCAGAASFRSNIGVAELMPDSILILPKETERVFATPEELLAHHLKIPLAMAKVFLMVTPPAKLLEEELGKTGMKVVAIEKAKVNKG